MSVWNWIHEALDNADDDSPVRELAEVFYSASGLYETDTDGAIALYDRGRAMAERAGEPWWALLFDHWKLQSLIFHKRDAKAARELAVRAAVEARKPIYAAFPQRICLHEDLIHVFDHIDPVGHHDKVIDALDYMEREVGADYECRHCIAGLRGTHAARIGDLEQAFECNGRAGQMAAEERQAHYLANAYSTLCPLLHQTGQWGDELLQAAKSGRQYTRPSRIDAQREFAAWEAVAQRRLGNEYEAKRAWEQFVRYDTMTDTPPAADCFDAMEGFHAASGDLEGALAVRERQVVSLEGSGMTFLMVQALLHRLALLRALGRATDEDARRVEAAARELVAPDWALSALASIVSGESDV